MEHFKQGGWISRLEFRKECSHYYAEKGLEEMCQKKSIVRPFMGSCNRPREREG